jgi:outer membrane lipoprotein SlyB
MARSSALLIALLLAFSGAGCTTDPATPQAGEESVRYGRIEQIDPAELQGDHQLGVGAIVGAAAGGILGSFIGHGTGADVAAVAGAIAGGFAGSAIQKRYVDKRPGQHITVRLSSGVAVAVTQPADPNLRVGHRVRIDGSGMRARVADCEQVSHAQYMGWHWQNTEAVALDSLAGLLHLFASYADELAADSVREPHSVITLCKPVEHARVHGDDVNNRSVNAGHAVAAQALTAHDKKLLIRSHFAKASPRDDGAVAYSRNSSMHAALRDCVCRGASVTSASRPVTGRSL